MTPSEATQVARLPLHWRRFIRRYYQLPSNVNVTCALSRAGISYTALVLMLVRRQGARMALEHLIGKPIVVGPSFVLKWRRDVNKIRVCQSTTWRDRRITYVDTTVSRKYGPLLRSGCTPRNLRSCGIPWRALQHYHETGHLRVRP